MSTYARIENGIVVEIVNATIDLDKLYTAAFIATLVPCDNSVQQYWTYNGSTFVAPAAPQ